MRTDHKRQLRDRIYDRRGHLEATIHVLGTKADTMHSERVHAVEEALGTLQMHLGPGGWDHVDQVEAAALSRWLDATETLVSPRAPEELAESVKLHLQGQRVLERAGFPERVEAEAAINPALEPV